MSRRLQVELGNREFEQIRMMARRQRMSVDDWILKVLREAHRSQPQRGAEAEEADRKLALLDRAMEYEFPTADIDQMLAEVQRGYLPSP